MTIALGLIALVVLAVILVTAALYYSILGLCLVGKHLLETVKWRRRAKALRIEAELDRTEEELRVTILHLAESLGAEAHEARRALLRESFRASGSLPGTPGITDATQR